MTVQPRRKAKSYLPIMVVEVGPDERYEIKDLTTAEYQHLAVVTDGEVQSRTTLVNAIGDGSPLAFQAVTFVMRKRQGGNEKFADVKVLMDDCNAWFIDEPSGREVEVKMADDEPCEKHEAGAVPQFCDKCQAGEPIFVGGQPVWVFEDDGEPVPTKAASAPSTAPHLMALSSESSTGSESGTQATGTA